MSDIPKINRIVNPVQTGETETSDKVTSPSSSGVSSTTDQLESAPSNPFEEVVGDSSDVQSIRETILGARAEGKLPLTENYLNRFINENPQQATAEASKDLKSWLTKNFFLTSVQQQEVNSISPEDLKVAENAISKAAESDAGVRVKITDLAPESEQKLLKLLDARQEKTRDAVDDLDLAWGKVKGMVGQEEAIKKAIEEKTGGIE